MNVCYVFTHAYALDILSRIEAIIWLMSIVLASPTLTYILGWDLLLFPLFHTHPLPFPTIVREDQNTGHETGMDNIEGRSLKDHHRREWENPQRYGREKGERILI